MSFTLTDEQWEEVKGELIKSFDEKFRDIAYEVIQQEINFEELTREYIDDKVESLREDDLFNKITDRIVSLYR